MAEIVQSLDSQSRSARDRLLNAVFPVRDARGALGVLARAWLDLAQARCAAVFYLDPSSSRVCVGFAAGDGSAWVGNTRWPESKTWSGPTAVTTVESKTRVFSSSGARLLDVEFACGGDVMGGVLLRDCVQQTVPRDAWGEVIDLSSAVLGQIAVVEAAGGCVSGDSPQFEAAKFEALAEFAAGAGHELNNPVATIAGRVQLLLGSESDPERRAALATIGGQAYRIRDMIGDLMVFGRPPQPELDSIDLASTVQATLTEFEARAVQQRAEIRFCVQPVETVRADPVQVAVVLSSLVQNSLESFDSGGVVTVEVARYSDQERNWAAVYVRDDGPGLSEADREHLFDPFYSGRQAGRGIGFGLPKTRRIVENHGGRIDVLDTDGPGAAFRVIWPLEDATGTDSTPGLAAS